MEKKFLSLFIAFVIGTFSFSSAASLYVCQGGKCSYINNSTPAKPWLRKLYPLFQQRNVRIDFCEANKKQRFCLAEGLNWYATSQNITAYFSIPVARTLPQRNTLQMDYLVRVNEFIPSCGFSLSTLEAMEDQTIRLVSHFFPCQVTDFGKTQIQNTFYIDYIDFDNAVLGAKYQIQTHGMLSSESAGYTLMKFRDGKTLRPLVVEPYYGEEPEVPDVTSLDRKMRHMTTHELTADQANQEHPLITEISDWWDELKRSFNLDNPSPTEVHEDDHWWTKFSHKFMKVFYLEPLE